MGVIMTEWWIMATARCSVPYYAKFDVLVGAIDWNNADQVIPATERVIHPTYERMFAWDDVAMIKLSRRIVFKSFIKQAACPSKPLTYERISGSPYIAAGFGLNGDDPTVQNKLQYNVMSGIDLETCRYSWERIRDFKMCTFDMDKNICFGDPGAPLMAVQFSTNSTTCLIGFASFHNPLSCETIDSPAAFNRADVYCPYFEQLLGVSFLRTECYTTV